MNKKGRQKFLDIFNLQEVIPFLKKVFKAEDYLKVI